MHSPYWPSSPVHHASLVDESSLMPELLELVGAKVTRHVIGHLADHVAEAVDFGLGRPSSSHGRGRPLDRQAERDDFAAFATDVIRKAEVQMPVILGALVYIDRATPHLRIAVKDWAHHRVFMGALILASKYLNDSSLRNAHWAICTGVFGKRDIGRIEREFLEVLDFELAVREADLMPHHAAIMSLGHPRLRSASPVHQSRIRHHKPQPRVEEPAYDSSPASCDSASPCTPPSFIPITPSHTIHHKSQPRAVPHASPQRPPVRPPRDFELSEAMQLLDEFPIPSFKTKDLYMPSPLSSIPHRHASVPHFPQYIHPGAKSVTSCLATVCCPPVDVDVGMHGAIVL